MISATHVVVKDDNIGWTEIVNALDIPIIYKVLGDKEDFVKDKHEDTVDIINKDLEMVHYDSKHQ